MEKSKKQPAGFFAVGDTVWWYSRSAHCAKWGIIYDFRDIPEKPLYACVHDYGQTSMHNAIKLSDCYASENECMDAEKRRATAQREEYKESIKTLEDFVVFLMKHQTNGVDRDMDAQAAAKERAEELGIKID